MYSKNDRIKVIRDEINQALGYPKAAEIMLEKLSLLGVDSGILAFCIVNAPLGNNDICSDQYITLKKVLNSNFILKKPMFIQEVRYASISLDYNVEEYINQVLPYDFAPIRVAFNELNKNNQALFVMQEHPSIVESKCYKLFQNNNGKKDIFVCAFPIGNGNLIWLALKSSNRYFSSDNVENLKLLFDDYGLGIILQRAIKEGSDLRYLGNSEFTNEQWDLMRYISTNNKISRQILQENFDLKPENLNKMLSKIANLHDFNLFKKERTGLLEWVHSFLYQKPLINWFPNRIIRPKGNPKYIED